MADAMRFALLHSMLDTEAVEHESMGAKVEFFLHRLRVHGFAVTHADASANGGTSDRPCGVIKVEGVMTRRNVSEFKRRWYGWRWVVRHPLRAYGWRLR